MGSGEREDGGEETLRRMVSPPDPDPEPVALSWAHRWTHSSSLSKRLQDPSLEHLFRC